MKRLTAALRLLSFAALLIALAPPRAGAESANDLARKGVGEYEKGNVEAAIESFKKAAELAPDDPKIQYNLGTALSKQGNYAEAIDALGRAISSQRGKASSSPRFNLGYSRVSEAMKKSEPGADPKEKMKGLRDGLEDFKQAILENPSDRDAKFNYEATKALLKQLQQQQQQSKGGKGDKSKDDKKDKQDKSDKQEQNQEGQDGEQNDKEQSQGQQGKDGKSQEGGGQDQQQQDDQKKPDDERQRKDQQGDKKDGKDGENKKDGQTQESGLEGTPTPKPQDGKQGDEKKDGQSGKQDGKPTPKPDKSQPQQPQPGAPGGQAEGEPKPQPLTPEQLNALRVLNSLEQEKPEQFKKLFRFQGKGSAKRPERSW